MRQFDPYSVLGVRTDATPEEVRKAFRKLVLELHPDRNPDPVATERFFQVTEAYEILRDAARKKEFDRIRGASSKPSPPPTKPQEEVRIPRTPPSKPKSTSKPKTHTPPPPKHISVTEDLLKLSGLVTKARFAEAEKLANKIIILAPREALPYAVLGDIARVRGDLDAASRYFSLAVQMDPKNENFFRKHEESLDALHRTNVRTVQRGIRDSAQPDPKASGPLMVGAALALACSGYVALGKEPPVFGLPIIDTWTVGLLSMLLIVGIGLGATLSFSGSVDRISSQFGTAVMTIPPGLALGLIAMINFWLAASVYVFVGISQDSMNPGTSKLVGAVAGSVLLMTLASAVNGRIEALQTFLWSGNVLYVAAVLGWLIADSFLDS